MGLALSLAPAGEENPCLSFADGVTIDIVPGPDYGPFWRDPSSGALDVPALSVPIGQVGSALVDVHIEGYIKAVPPPKGKPISRGDATGLELAIDQTRSVLIEMVCTDSDDDGLLDIEEDCNLNGKRDTDAPYCDNGSLYETDPYMKDTDGGGVPDGNERDNLTDPLDPNDDLILYGMFPRVVYPGDEVVIAGRGFSRNLYANVVRFGEKVAQNVSIDANLRYLEVRAPEGLAPGDALHLPVSVDVDGVTPAPLQCIPGGSHLASIPVGTYPNNVLMSPDGTRAYVINQGSADLSVIDLQGFEEVTGTAEIPRISLGEDPMSMDIAPDGTLLYVVNRLSEDVTPIDTVNLSPAAPAIPVGPEPWDIVMLPERPRAYVLNHGARALRCVSVLDTSEHIWLEDLDFPFDLFTTAQGVEIALNHDGSRAWISHYPDHHIYRIDTANDQVPWEETVLDACLDGRDFCFTRDGERAYAFGPGRTPGGYTLLTEIPADRNLLVIPECLSVGVPYFPMDMVLSPQDDRLYIASYLSTATYDLGNLFVLDLASGEGDVALVSSSATDLALSPDGRHLMVADVVEDSVYVFDADAETILAEADVHGSMGLSANPVSDPDIEDYWRELHRNRMDLTKDGSRLVTVNALSGDVSVLAVADPLPFLLGTIPQSPALDDTGICCDPRLVASSPDGTRAYVTGDGTYTLSVIDTRTHKVVRTYEFGEWIDYVEPGNEAPYISQLLVSVDGANAYVSVSTYRYETAPYDLICRIDLQEESVAAVRRMDWTPNAQAPINLTPDGNKIYYTRPELSEVLVLDSGTLDELQTVPVYAREVVFHPSDPGLACLTQEGGLVLLDPQTSNLIDADNDAETTSPGLPAGISRIELGTDTIPSRPQFHPDGKRLFMMDQESYGRKILMVDLAENRLAHALDASGKPFSLCPGPAGRKLYVLVGGLPEIQVYDLNTLELVHRIPVSRNTLSMRLTPDGSQLLVMASGGLHVVDTSSDQVMTTVTVPTANQNIGPLVVSPTGALAYIAFNPPFASTEDLAAGIHVIRIPAPF